MSRMFLDPKSNRPIKTWNVVTGCSHNCTYCCARRLAVGRLQHNARYKDGFEVVKFHESEMKKTFQPGDMVFVSFMGDLFCPPVPNEWIDRVISRTKQFPETDFLFLSKNNRRFIDFDFGANAILGTTLETNRNYPSITLAVSPRERARWLSAHPHPRKMVSIEPVMDFDLEEFALLLQILKPELVEIGADNYHCHLPEPSALKVNELVRRLREFTVVKEKDSLKRLK